jgi:hypothetical protein
MIRNLRWTALLSCIFLATAGAQQGTPSPSAKPQTLVLSGCLNDASRSTTGTTGADSAMAQARYSLRQVQYGSSGAAFDDWMRAHPQLTSTMAVTGASGSGGARDGRPNELHLGTAREPNVDLSKYVGQNIEVTGTLGPIPGADKQAGAAPRTNSRGATSNTSTSSSPMLTVTAVKVLSGKCSG